MPFFFLPSCLLTHIVKEKEPRRNKIKTRNHATSMPRPSKCQAHWESDYSFQAKYSTLDCTVMYFKITRKLYNESKIQPRAIQQSTSWRNYPLLLLLKAKCWDQKRRIMVVWININLIDACGMALLEMWPCWRKCSLEVGFKVSEAKTRPSVSLFLLPANLDVELFAPPAWSLPVCSHA